MTPPSPWLLIPEDPNHDPRHADHPGHDNERHKQRETENGFSDICALIFKVSVHCLSGILLQPRDKVVNVVEDLFPKTMRSGPGALAGFVCKPFG